MASMKLEEHWEEQPNVEKPINGNFQEPSENVKTNGANLTKSAEGMDKESTNLPSSHRHRKLPAELNREIFYCFTLATRRKFICGLGWGFYAMFRQILLKKSKRICNPAEGNGWLKISRDVTISDDGLVASMNTNTNERRNAYADKGFPISVVECRADDFPGTICYYYEVKTQSKWCMVGLLHDGYIFGLTSIGIGGFNRSLYAITTISTNGLTGNNQYSELPVGARPEPLNFQGNVYGCGILIHPDNNVTMFFTFNGLLLEKQIPISSSVDDCLFPIVSIWGMSTLEANFGDDKDKPFAYDIRKCPGMGLDCI